MSNYRKGRRREWRTRHYLQKLGCPKLIRSAKSSGAIDIVAVYSNEVLWIQVKSGRACRISPEEYQELREWATLRPQDKVQIWFWKNRARKPEITPIQPREGC